MFWYAHRDWLCRHGAHSLMLTGVILSAFRLWSNHFSRVLSLTALKTKKLPTGSFFALVRAQGLALPPRRSFAKLTGVLKSAFRLWSNPSSSVLSLMALKTKKLPTGSFFVLVRAQGLASPPRRSFAKAHRHTSSAFRLWSNPSSSVLSLMALKTKKTPKRELFCFGTRTGIRTLDPLIKSQLL